MYPMKTAGGYLMDEASSALQKCIRRGLEREACFWAQEIHSIGANYLWKRLVTIAHEDVGVADQQALLFFDMCWKHFLYWQGRNEFDHFTVINAVVALCRAQKTRTADHLGVFSYETETLLPVPDFALDRHTARGREMGRGWPHWLEDGTKLDPPDPSPYIEEFNAQVIKNKGSKFRKWVQAVMSKKMSADSGKPDGPDLFGIGT